MKQNETEMIIIGLDKYPTVKGYCKANRFADQFRKLKEILK